MFFILAHIALDILFVTVIVAMEVITYTWLIQRHAEMYSRRRWVLRMLLSFATVFFIMWWLTPWRGEPHTGAGMYLAAAQANIAIATTYLVAIAFVTRANHWLNSRKSME